MFSTLSLITLAFIAIVILAFVWPLNFSRRTKIVLSVIVCLLPCKSYISLFVGGTPFDPEIPYNLTFITDLGRSTLIFLALCVILRSIANGITKLVKWSKQAALIPAQSPFYALLVFMVAFGLATYGTSCGYGRPVLQKYDVTMDKLDPRFDGLKIIQLADIHVSAPTDVKMIYDMVKRINALEPDLVLIPGDIIDGSVEDRKPITDLLFDLKAKYGVFISTGNHEYYSGYTMWREYFEQGGFTSLDNRVLALTDNQGKTLLNLAGITDPVAERFGLPLPDIKGVTAGIDSTAPSIVLSHRPQFATDLAATKNVDLVLSGHTHGGLVVGLDRLVARANGGFVSGWYDLANNTKLIVSNGTMIWMGFPLRIGVPGQINEITLHSKEKPNSQTYSLTRKGELQRIKEQEAQPVLSLGDNPNHADDEAQTATTATTKTTTGSTGSSANGAAAQPNQSGAQSSQRSDLASVQLILPMQNTQSGEVENNITNLAVLPENLTADQIARIKAIINEDPVTRQQAQAERQAAAKNTPYVSVKLLKEAAPATPDAPAQDAQDTQAQSQDQSQDKAQQPDASADKADKAAAQPAQQSQDQAGSQPQANAKPLVSIGSGTEAKQLAHQEKNGTTAVDIDFALVPQAPAEVNYELNAFLDTAPHSEDDVVQPYSAEIKYSPQYGSDSDGPSAFEDNLSLELQVLYSISLGEGNTQAMGEQDSVKDLLR